MTTQTADRDLDGNPFESLEAAVAYWFDCYEKIRQQLQTALTVTPDQLRVLEFYVQHLRAFYYAPTIREVGAGLGLTPGGVMYHLTQLKSRGLMSCSRPGAARAWAPTTRASKMFHGEPTQTLNIEFEKGPECAQKLVEG